MEKQTDQKAEGAFSQIEAIFVSTEVDARVVLLLNLLHRNQEMSFPVQGVRKLGDNAFLTQVY